MKRFLSWLLGIFGCFSLVFVLLFSSFHLCLSDNGWFQTELYRLDSARKSGHKVSELMDALEDARLYLAGNSDSDTDFTSREEAALKAVSRPISTLRTAFFISLGLCVLFFLTVPFAMRREWLVVFSRSYIITAGIWLVPVVWLTAAVGAGFAWISAWARYLFIPKKIAQDTLLGALFSDNLLYDLVMRALKISLILIIILLIAAIVFTVLRARRRRSAVLVTRRKQTH